MIEELAFAIIVIAISASFSSCVPNQHEFAAGREQVEAAKQIAISCNSLKQAAITASQPVPKCANE